MYYFDKNWTECQAIWKGHERLESVTFGMSTTNFNESLHGKVKPSLNRRKTITQCFRKLRMHFSNSQHRARYIRFTNTLKVHCVTNNTDATVTDIKLVCTPFVASLIRQQYELSLKMDALPESVPIDTEKCSCTFHRSRGFPCAHMFLSRRLEGNSFIN